MVHTDAAPTCLIKSDKNKNLFFEMIFFIVPGSRIFFETILGSLVETANPAKKNAALIKKISFSSFAIPAATIPTNQPSA